MLKGYGNLVTNADGSFIAACENGKKIEISLEGLNARACKVESKSKNDIFFSEGIDGIFQEKYFFSAPLARIINSKLIMEKGLEINSEMLTLSSQGVGSFDKMGNITLEGPGTTINYLGSEMQAEKLIVEDENIFLYGDSFFENDFVSFSSKGPIYYWNYEENDVLSAKSLDSLTYFMNDKKPLSVKGKDFFMYLYGSYESLIRVSNFSLTLDNYLFFSEKVSIKKLEDSLHIRSIEGEMEIKNDKNSIYTKELILFNDSSWKAISGVRIVF